MCSDESANPVEHFDIVIVGAGMAGSALALALTRSAAASNAQLHVAIVEQRELPTGTPPLGEGVQGYDLRASALTQSTIRWLNKIGCWQQVKSQRASAFVDMQVWVEDGTGQISFSAAEVGETELGEVVENRVLTSTLLNAARESETISLIDGEEVTGLELPRSAGEGERVQLELASGRQLSASLVVAADGAASPVRTIANFPVRRWVYGHDAIVCTVLMEMPHRATAYQCFTRWGPVAFLPLESGRADSALCTIVWSQEKPRAESLMAMTDADFCEALAAALEHRLGRVLEIGRRQSFPLTQMHAIDYYRPGLVLVADAAHTVHPLAGQGINLGLADVAELSSTIDEALEKGRPVNDERLLKRYQRRRKTDNLAMMAIIEGFKRIYRPLPLPAMLLRNEGMNLLDRHTLLKNRIIRYAMGVDT